MKNDTSGPAFPLSLKETWYEGMTLRDYFAANAMQGLLASGWCEVARELTPGDGERMVAKDAYLMADSMLKARGK